MNGLSPEGTRLDAIGDADPVIARPPDPEPTMAQSNLGTATVHEATGEVVAPSGEATSEGPAAEVAQLEALLDARTRELQGLRAEATRVRGLLRDAVERFDTNAVAAAEQVLSELRRERDQAVARALESEAARAEIRFRLDEVMGHLAAAGATDGALPGERPDVTCARLTGTVRGLLSALAETQEGREMAQARLMLAEQDLADVQAAARTLEREQAEAREQLELEQMKMRRLNERLRGALERDAASALRGECDGMRARGDETERALDNFSARIIELEQKVAREIENRGEVGATLAGAQAERLVLLEELARARADAAAISVSLDASEAERARAMQGFAQQLDAAQRSAVEPQVRASRHADALREAREQWIGLATSLRSALQRTGTWTGFDRPPTGEDTTQPGIPTYIEAVEGFEVQLAASEERVRQLEARLASAAATVGGIEASAPTPDTAARLAALRALLERR